MKKKNIMNNESAKGRHIGLPLRWMTMMMAALAFTACSNDDDTLTAEQEITLTTPVIQLSGVQASTRAVQDMADVASRAIITLYLHDSEAREYNQNRAGDYVNSDLSNESSWTANSSVTVTGGEGHYRAGIYANISLKATDAMSEIRDAVYAYRGSVNVKAKGTFTPDGTLQPYSAAVLLKLKDADGKYIDPMGYDTTSGKVNWTVYLIKPVGLALMNGFVPTDANGNVDADGQYFPNGTAAPVPNANTWPAYYLSTANGNYTPGTYPATWENNVLVTSGAPSNVWPLFEVTYCKDGFKLNDDASDYVPLGTATTWTVRYPGEQQLTLEAGKLYTFTAALGAYAYISIKASDVSISDWSEGETINVGR